jgi:D-alanine-D-alanine ligase
MGAECTPQPDVFFNAIHGAGGEDGQLFSYLEMLKVPCTGAGRLALAASMDKWMAKQAWLAEGLTVTPFRAISENGWNMDRQGFIAQCLPLGLPLFVKPANAGSSIGIEKVKLPEDLPNAIDRAFKYDRRVLVEKGLDAREIEVAVLGGADPVASVPGEVLPAGEFYDFADKYLDGKSSTRVPAELPGNVAKSISEMARRAFMCLDGYGMARVDFFLEKGTDQIFLNELNAIPGFTSISMFPKLMEAAGVPYKDQLTKLIELAMERHGQMSAKQAAFSSGSGWFRPHEPKA